MPRREGTGQRPDANTVEVKGLELAQVGHLAFSANVELHELSEHRFDLEQLFFSLTQGEYTGQSMGNAPVGPMGGTAAYHPPPPGYAQPAQTPEAGR